MVKKLSSRDTDLFRRLLLRLRAELSGDIGNLESDALGADGHRTPVDNPADAGSDSFSQEFSLELLQREETTLTEIDDALERIDSGSFGVCEDCERAIPKVRLQAIPFARLCIECKRASEQA